METNGPWEIKSSENKYTNPWISVREDQVIRPDGKDGFFGVVEMVDGVSVLPIDNEGNVYLTYEFHYAIKEDSIEVISGAIEGGETDIEAGKRELKEETGIVANKMVNLGIVNPFTTVVKSAAHLYLAQELSFEKANPEGTEQIEIIKLPFDEVVQMVMDSKITHGPSCVLIMKAHHYLQDN